MRSPDAAQQRAVTRAGGSGPCCAPPHPSGRGVPRPGPRLSSPTTCPALITQGRRSAPTRFCPVSRAPPLGLSVYCGITSHRPRCSPAALAPRPDRSGRRPPRFLTWTTAARPPGRLLCAPRDLWGVKVLPSPSLTDRESLSRRFPRRSHTCNYRKIPAPPRTEAGSGHG